MLEPARRAPVGLTLRVSLLEQCQYDCGYCRPGATRTPTSSSERLTAAEYGRLGRVLATLGIAKVRFTGGEPLLRPDVIEVVRAFRAALPKAELALTTNGARLGALLEPLVEAGLSRATVHVDSLKPERYRALMGEGDLDAVLGGVTRAKAGLASVKLNVVVQRGQNDDELFDFLDWSRREGVEVRFIELMNTGSARAYVREVFFTGREVVARVEQARGVQRLPRRHPADPAALFQTGDGVVFGVIASDTEPFCGACNRLRLSADGRLRTCLYEAVGAPVGKAVREGASDEWLAGMVKAVLRGKQSRHPAVAPGSASFSMADVGG